jgi:hypothetical protein
MTAATAMTGTAVFGPYTWASTGRSMIEEPVPMTPLTIPAMRPMPRIRRRPMFMPNARPSHAVPPASAAPRRLSRCRKGDILGCGAV